MVLDREGMLPCRYCGSKNVYMENDDLGWFGKCEHCGFEALYSDTRDQALADWNRREKRPQEPDNEGGDRDEGHNKPV